MKGQAVSLDLVLSVIILSLLAFTLVSFLSAESKNAEMRFLDEKRDRLALSALSELASSSGRPDNWGYSNCERLGLSSEQGTFDSSKVIALRAMYLFNYNRTRSLLNLGAYDISILVCSSSNYSSCTYNMSTSARELDRQTSNHVSRVEAVSTLNGQTVSLIMYVWE